MPLDFRKHIVVLQMFGEDECRLRYGLGVELSGRVFAYIHQVLALIPRIQNYVFVSD